jgi:hypothetical protein
MRKKSFCFFVFGFMFLAGCNNKATENILEAQST